MRHQTRIAYLRILSASLILSLLFSQMTQTVMAAASATNAVTDAVMTVAAETSPSTRVIVELASPPLAAAFAEQARIAGTNAQFDVNTADAQAYISQLQAEQATFLSTLQSVVPDAAASTFINETGAAEQATYQVVFNGVSVDVGSTDRAEARRRLSAMPGVKAVYLDQPHYTQLYTSTAPGVIDNIGSIFDNIFQRGQAFGGVETFNAVDTGIKDPIAHHIGFGGDAAHGANIKAQIGHIRHQVTRGD